MRDIDRTGLDEDGFCGNTTTNEQPLAEMDIMVLYCNHEYLHGR